MSIRNRITFDEALPKRVSYIVATKNRATPYLKNVLIFLKDIISSRDEIIVVDGFSSDNSREIIDEFIDIIDVFISEPDMNLGHAYNKGILLANGRYIKIIHDDDVYHEEAMEQAIDVLEKRKNIDILLCGGTKQRGDKIWNVYVPPGKNFGRKVQDLFNYSSNWVGMLARRSSLAQIGLVDTSVFAYDTEFLCRSIYLGLTVRFCRLNAYHHVLYDHSGTIAQEERFYSDQEEIKKKYLEAPQNITGSKQKLKQLIRFIIPGVFIPYLRRIYNYLRRVNITQVQESTNNNEPVWDGGIS